MAVEGFESGLEFDGKAQRVEYLSFASALLRHTGADVFPEIAELGHVAARDIVSDGYAGEFDDAALDGIHEGKIAHGPGKEGAFGVAGTAQEEGGGGEVDDLGEAKLAVNDFQTGDPEPRGLPVFLCLRLFLARELAFVAGLFTVAVVCFVVDDQDVFQTHQIRHDALDHLAFGFESLEVIATPLKCAWIATGNNIQLGGDMPRRCYWIRLDAKQSQPFRRTDFQHSDLRAWVREHRGELISALLTIARYWYAQGRPEPKKVKPIGSFESWCNVIGGMLEAAGVDGFLANADTMFDQADSEAAQWEAFLLALADVFIRDSFRATDVVEKLQAHDSGALDMEPNRLKESLPDFLAEAADKTGGFLQRRLGRCFAERAGRRYGESQVFLERADEDRKSKVLRWRVVRR